MVWVNTEWVVQETVLQPGNTAFIANYRCYRNDRVRFGQSATGVTAIYIKNHFDHNSIPTPDIDLIGATIIEIKIGSIPPIKMISAYIKPNLRGGFSLEDFKKLLNSGPNVIIAGDLNAIHINWNNYNCNSYGCKFFNYISKVEGVRVIAPHSPTHLNHSSSDTVLDICVQKRILFNSESHVLNKLNSDHLPVTLAIDTGSFAINSPELFSTNWENFRHILNSKPLPPFQIKSNDNIESAVGTLGKFFKETLKEASKQKFSKPPDRLPDFIRNKIRLRNYFRRIWQQTGDPHFHSEFQKIESEITEDTSKFYSKRYEEFLQDLSPSNQLWRKTSQLQRSFTPIPPSPEGRRRQHRNRPHRKS
ncbi:hypothetical protein AVEN_21132-1 [Araneus ventricosus]|uniref:Endonuclease/exonuclease/phosphatase domain-containing protein n=1 Tax=Araneus ventricosus TaxID=182803 RepID=A0A4Y2L4F6_ARAVE|nr:hypothetical protein AVEN_21132-1 [Araneus ventricosus]